MSIDNNRVEREAKHFAVGRKNFLFCHTESGANSSAVLYSIVETCKVNGVNPTQYLTYLFGQLAHVPSDLEPLMPWNFEQD
ncbi:hypothetical protein D5018_21230 [Parashewanella curva]|uniref:Uncharacterized protein n=1 Tax=Parashewanella curva TaxID=2338552 RepID=A0A3L8PTF5_9GAMM|nr:hypothetical protein D5018_21230 [Parashewanella curva]